MERKNKAELYTADWLLFQSPPALLEGREWERYFSSNPGSALSFLHCFFTYANEMISQNLSFLSYYLPNTF